MYSRPTCHCISMLILVHFYVQKRPWNMMQSIYAPRLHSANKSDSDKNKEKEGGNDMDIDLKQNNESSQKDKIGKTSHGYQCDVENVPSSLMGKDESKSKEIDEDIFFIDTLCEAESALLNLSPQSLLNLLFLIMEIGVEAGLERKGGKGQRYELQFDELKIYMGKKLCPDMLCTSSNKVEHAETFEKQVKNFQEARLIITWLEKVLSSLVSPDSLNLLFTISRELLTAPLLSSFGENNDLSLLSTDNSSPRPPYIYPDCRLGLYLRHIIIEVEAMGFEGLSAVFDRLLIYRTVPSFDRLTKENKIHNPQYYEGGKQETEDDEEKTTIIDDEKLRGRKMNVYPNPNIDSRMQIERYLETQIVNYTKLQGSRNSLTYEERDAELSALLSGYGTLPRAHFLCYLNCLEHRDFRGSLLSLHRYFDYVIRRHGGIGYASVLGSNSGSSLAGLMNLSILHSSMQQNIGNGDTKNPNNDGNNDSTITTLEEKYKHLFSEDGTNGVSRFSTGAVVQHAVLKLAGLHVKFKHWDEANSALIECIRMAHIGGDNACVILALIYQHHIIRSIGGVSGIKEASGLLIRCLQQAVQQGLPSLSHLTFLLLASYQLASCDQLGANGVKNTGSTYHSFDLSAITHDMNTNSLSIPTPEQVQNYANMLISTGGSQLVGADNKSRDLITEIPTGPTSNKIKDYLHSSNTAAEISVDSLSSESHPAVVMTPIDIRRPNISRRLHSLRLSTFPIDKSPISLLLPAGGLSLADEGVDSLSNSGMGANPAAMRSQMSGGMSMTSLSAWNHVRDDLLYRPSLEDSLASHAQRILVASSTWAGLGIPIMCLMTSLQIINENNYIRKETDVSTYIGAAVRMLGSVCMGNSPSFVDFRSYDDFTEEEEDAGKSTSLREQIVSVLRRQRRSPNSSKNPIKIPLLIPFQESLLAFLPLLKAYPHTQSNTLLHIPFLFLTRWASHRGEVINTQVLSRKLRAGSLSFLSDGMEGYMDSLICSSMTQVSSRKRNVGLNGTVLPSSLRIHSLLLKASHLSSLSLQYVRLLILYSANFISPEISVGSIATSGVGKCFATGLNVTGMSTSSTQAINASKALPNLLTALAIGENSGLVPNYAVSLLMLGHWLLIMQDGYRIKSLIGAILPVLSELCSPNVQAQAWLLLAKANLLLIDSSLGGESTRSSDVNTHKTYSELKSIFNSCQETYDHGGEIFSDFSKAKDYELRKMISTLKHVIRLLNRSMKASMMSHNIYLLREIYYLQARVYDKIYSLTKLQKRETLDMLNDSNLVQQIGLEMLKSNLLDCSLVEKKNRRKRNRASVCFAKANRYILKNRFGPFNTSPLVNIKDNSQKDKENQTSFYVPSVISIEDTISTSSINKYSHSFLLN